MRKRSTERSGYAAERSFRLDEAVSAMRMWLWLTYYEGSWAGDPEVLANEDWLFDIARHWASADAHALDEYVREREASGDPVRLVYGESVTGGTTWLIALEDMARFDAWHWRHTNDEIWLQRAVGNTRSEEFVCRRAPSHDTANSLIGDAQDEMCGYAM